MSSDPMFHVAAAAAAKSLQSCPTLCDPVDGSPPGSPVLGILQARTLEWIAISSSRESSPPRDWIYLSWIAGGFFTAEPPGKLHVRLSAFIYQNIFYRDTKLPEPLSIIIHLSFFHFLKWMYSSFGYSSLILQLLFNPNRCQELC